METTESGSDFSTSETTEKREPPASETTENSPQWEIKNWPEEVGRSGYVKVEADKPGGCTHFAPKTFEASLELGELFGALAKAQGEMGAAIKDSENPYYSSKYADLNSVIQAAKEPLSKNGLAIIQLLQSAGGEVTVDTLLTHESGQWIKSSLQLKSIKTKKVNGQTIETPRNDVQGYGSTITYMRRYAYAAIIGLAQADSDGNDEETEVPKDMTPNPVFIKTMDAIVDSSTLEALDEFVKNLSDMDFSEAQTEKLRDTYRKKRTQMEEDEKKKKTKIIRATIPDTEFIRIATQEFAAATGKSEAKRVGTMVLAEARDRIMSPEDIKKLEKMINGGEK